jgi:hypothetical protein
MQGRGMERTQCAQCWRTGFETICIVERRAGGGDDYILSVPVVKSLKHSIGIQQYVAFKFHL